MRRSLVLIVALACSRPAPRDDYTLRIAVAGPLAPLSHDTQGSASVYGQDLVYQTFLRPEGTGFTSQVFARWSREAGQRLRALLADGLRFSDGSQVEVEDVVRSIRAAGLAVRAEGRWLEIEPGPTGLPVDTGLMMAVLFKATPSGELGTGPFHLLRGNERRLALERTTPAPGRIRRVELVSVASTREAFARVLKGEANAVTDLDDRQVELADGVPGLRILRTRGPHALAIIFNSHRLGRDLRRRITDALPVDEIEEVSQGKGCGPTSARRPTETTLNNLPQLDISVGILDGSVERAGLALRRSLGTQGGHIARVGIGEISAARAQSALTVDNALAWPPAIGALYWKTGAPANVSGYSNPAYDAAVEAGDFDRAEAELKKDPPALLLCRRERIAAVDSRLRNATLGSWGYFDTLPEWEVTP